MRCFAEPNSNLRVLSRCFFLLEGLRVYVEGLVSGRCALEDVKRLTKMVGAIRWGGASERALLLSHVWRVDIGSTIQYLYIDTSLFEYGGLNTLQ